jgi:uroporphyrin-III C-methyltransferase/precorrin-2 dehydrogenase/sirohydrochlorin ferrochelatase
LPSEPVRDPDLVTVAGLKALRGADVVVADRLVPCELLARLTPDVELIDVAKYPRSRFIAQEDINAALLDRAQAGRNVVCLKGGDSFVFGRGFEEVLHLHEAGMAVRVIPGLSSSISVQRSRVSRHPPGPRSRVQRRLWPRAARPSDSLVNWNAHATSKGPIVLLWRSRTQRDRRDPHQWRT